MPRYVDGFRDRTKNNSNNNNNINNKSINSNPKKSIPIYVYVHTKIRTKCVIPCTRDDRRGPKTMLPQKKNIYILYTKQKYIYTKQKYIYIIKKIYKNYQITDTIVRQIERKENPNGIVET